MDAPGKRRPILALILILAAARPLVLFKSQTHVNSDESVIGLMAKRVQEGCGLPFYMDGQDYNAGAAWEASLAAPVFAVFGAGAVALKSVVVLLSLATLFAFYAMARRAYGPTTAGLAALVFALSPPLLKWHFQVRGYSFYFLSIPLLTILFLSIESGAAAAEVRAFLLGLASGLSLWSLELGLPLIAAFWLLLIARRKLSARGAAAGAAGFLLGYGPALAFNLAHHFANWRAVFVDKAPGRLLLEPSTYGNVFFRELPKFFGPDTVYWYYPETPAAGLALYALAAAAAALAVLRIRASSSKMRSPLDWDRLGGAEKNDLFMLLFASACFLPYLAAPLRVPGYFLGGYFFLAVLIGRLLERCLSAPARNVRRLGGVLFLVCVWTGVEALIGLAKQDRIETLVLCRREDGAPGIFPPQRPARIPGADLEAVERRLRRDRISSVWAAMPFVHPLVFESGGTLDATDPILHSERWIDPDGASKSSPAPQAFVIETAAPYRAAAEAKMAGPAGETPLVAEYGTLTVLEPPRPGPRPRP